MYLRYIILFLTATPGDAHSWYPHFTENETLRGEITFLMSPREKGRGLCLDGLSLWLPCIPLSTEATIRVSLGQA